MTTTYDPKITALLCIDFCNDFLSEAENSGRGSRTSPRRSTCSTIFAPSCGPPARRESRFITFRIIAGSQATMRTGNTPLPYQLGAAERQAFAKDTWGGTFHDDFQVQPGDIVATEHWASSGFPNTDLEHKLKRYGKEKIICIGLLANTCLEATARVGMELGFHVTLVRDGTAARSHEALHAALDIDGPTFAQRF